MKRSPIAALLLWTVLLGLWAAPARAQALNVTTPWITCDATVIYDASTNGSTQLVALAANQSIYICGYSIFAAGTVNVELDYGTGSACASNNVKMVPAYEFTAQTGMSDQSPQYRGLKTAIGTALCLKTSSGVAVQAIVYYRQFSGP